MDRGVLNRIIEKAKSLGDGEEKPKHAEIERIKESWVGYQAPGHFLDVSFIYNFEFVTSKFLYANSFPKSWRFSDIKVIKSFQV